MSSPKIDDVVQCLIDDATALRDHLVEDACRTFPRGDGGTEIPPEVDAWRSAVELCDAIEKLGKVLGSEHQRYLKQVRAYERKTATSKRGAK